MRARLQIYDAYYDDSKLQFVEMDLYDFISTSGILIHPLLRKLYNPYSYSHSFELSGVSDLMSLWPLDQSNFDKTSEWLGFPAVTLAAAASGCTYVVTKATPDHVEEWDYGPENKLQKFKQYSAEEFVDLYIPVPTKLT